MPSRLEREAKLDSGLVVTYVLPWLADCILDGDIPLDAVAKLSASEEERGEMSKEEVAQATLEIAGIASMRRFNENLVVRMVRSVDGEAMRIESREQLRDIFDEEEFQELAKIGRRDKDPNSGEA